MTRARSDVPHFRETATRQLFAALSRAGTDSERQNLTERILRLNLPLADALAARYAGRGAEADDLVQVARTALMMAVQRFRPELDRSFAAFAVPTVTGELKRYFRDHCWVVRPPRSLQELRARATVARDEAEQRLGRRPSISELATELRVDPLQLSESLGCADSYQPLSLDAPAQAEGRENLGDLLTGGADLASTSTDRIALHRVLAALPARDRQVIEWRYGEDCTQAEIGRRLGVSQMQVSRILAAILTRARAALDPLATPLVG